MQDLFCANFGRAVIGCTPCKRMWCPGCHTSSPRVWFHIARRQGEAIDLTVGSEDNKDQMTLVWRRKKRDADAFKKARRGDDLMVYQFECDWCVFLKLKKKLPDLTIATDVLLMACIRRATLDAFWSRAGSTVNGQATLVQKGIALSKLNCGSGTSRILNQDHFWHLIIVATEWPFSYS